MALVNIVAIQYPLYQEAVMIVYSKFWETMRRCGESTYTLINKYHISSGTIDRIRKGQGISTAKVDDFCRIFHCRVEDIITYVEPEDAAPPKEE